MLRMLPKRKSKSKTEWIEVGWQGILFKIPKGYNHQLVKETELLIKLTVKSTLNEVHKFLKRNEVSLGFIRKFEREFKK